MPPRCSVCSHPERSAIDAAILGSTPNRRIAAHHGLTEQAIRRHHAHVARRIQQHDAAQARTLAALMAKGHQVIDEVLVEADPELRLKALDRLAKLAELEFGSKSKVETTAKPPAADTLEDLHELRRDVDAAIAEKEKGIQ